MQEEIVRAQRLIRKNSVFFIITFVLKFAPIIIIKDTTVIFYDHISRFAEDSFRLDIESEGLRTYIFLVHNSISLSVFCVFLATDEEALRFIGTGKLRPEAFGRIDNLKSL
jgi:hypothetical protein